jgi:hypothetical protein
MKLVVSMKHKQEHGREGKVMLFLTNTGCHKDPQVSRTKGGLSPQEPTRAQAG